VVLRLNEYLRVFHILDSLPNNSIGKREANQLQRILLNHFEGETFKEGRISTNVAKVIPVAFHCPLINPIT
jgi:hypothetical protein